MGMNEFGEGAVVQPSLIETNGNWHMEQAINYFKKSHPTRIDSLRLIVVDKDLNEIRVLKSFYLTLKIKICHFHVINRYAPSGNLGTYAEHNASQDDAAVHKMEYDLSEDKSHSSLQGMCDHIGLQAFCVLPKKLGC